MDEKEIEKDEKNIEKLKQEVLNCKKCGLWKTRTNSVLGGGRLNLKVMFVGEAPGFNEDLQGKPFVGQAGKILDELLDFVELERDSVYITNILKCRPPKNRNPTSEEINHCSIYLDRQIQIIEPKIICCLGNFAAAYILEKFDLKNKIQGISKIHGQVFKVLTLFGIIKIIPLYHPAVGTYDSTMISMLKKDFEILKREMKNEKTS